jgi:hypothetical protein
MKGIDQKHYLRKVITWKDREKENIYVCVCLIERKSERGKAQKV